MPNVNEVQAKISVKHDRGRSRRSKKDCQVHFDSKLYK